MTQISPILTIRFTAGVFNVIMQSRKDVVTISDTICAEARMIVTRGRKSEERRVMKKVHKILEKVIAKAAGLQTYRKHNRIAYFICCLMIFICVLFTACGEGASNEENISGEGASNEENISGEGNPANAEKKPEWVYVPERIEIADKRADYDGMQLVGDTVCYISLLGGSEDETQNICRYSLSDRELTSIPFEWKDGGSIRETGGCYTFDENGNVWLIANVYASDYSQFRCFLYKFDAGGKSIFFQDVTEQLGRGVAMSGMAVDGQGRIYIFSGAYSEKTGIWLYTEDGSYHGAIPYDSSENVQIKGAVEGEDGRFYLCISKGEDADHCTLAEVDFERKQLTESIKDFPAVNGVCADPAGQYDCLLYDDTAVYGYDLTTQKKEELLVWGDSDVNGYFAGQLSLLEGGVYFCAVADWANNDTSIVLLTKTRSEEVSERLDLALATVEGGSGLAALAVNFNRNNDQYHITVKNYGSPTDLYNAILAKETIDIIDLSGVNIENLSRKSVFEDLGVWLDQSETFARSDFLDGILEAYTVDGALVGIPESFWLRTVVGDGNMAGNGGGLTLEELLAIAESTSGTIPLGEITREEMIQYLMMFNEDAFIDRETGECHFDSAQFKAVLELCSRFPEGTADNGQGGFGAEEASLPSRIQNGDVLFAVADMTMPKSFQLYGGIFGENAACVGFPTMDGKGGTLLFADNAFGIVANSGNKSGAWDFVESVLERKNTDGMDNEEVWYAYYSPGELWQYPTAKKAMSAIIDYVMEEDKDGRFSTLFYEDGWFFTHHALTWDEVNAVLDLTPDATPYFSVEDDPIIQIINEEAGAYYSGQKSIDDVVSIIQNRVQLYVDENN